MPVQAATGTGELALMKKQRDHGAARSVRLLNANRLKRARTPSEESGRAVRYELALPLLEVPR